MRKEKDKMSTLLILSLIFFTGFYRSNDSLF